MTLFTLSATCNAQYQWKILGCDREIKIWLCATACINRKAFLLTQSLKQDLKKPQNTNLSSVHQNMKAAVQHLLMPLTVRVALSAQQHYQGTL